MVGMRPSIGHNCHRVLTQAVLVLAATCLGTWPPSGFTQAHMTPGAHSSLDGECLSERVVVQGQNDVHPFEALHCCCIMVTAIVINHPCSALEVLAGSNCCPLVYI